MVKSNKFDYTGRTSSGPKLGKSIASDLEKRADKKQREAIKASSAPRLSFKLPASATRGSRKDRSKNKDARDNDDKDKDDRDPAKHDMHKLDLRVPSKSLTDEGFGLLADGLAKALETCHDLALVDLNLSANNLTTRSLALLAPIIAKSRYSLQTLDLSHNNFRVSTPAEAQAWEKFLKAFRPCMTLRRLDLSGNPSLGSRAFEILARVYMREPPVEPLPATGYHSLITLPDDTLPPESVRLDHASYPKSAARNGNAPELPPCANGKTMADNWVLNYRCGLRSIPYLTFCNVGLDDTGALFLSYVLEQHFYPIQLITEINAIEATSQIRTYRQDSNTNGVDWDHNTESLSKDGLHLLQCTEKLRNKLHLGDADSMSSFWSTSQLDLHDAGYRRPPGTNARRVSIRSIHSIDYSIYDKSDIHSARKKIQRNTIVQAGCASVELWHAALNAIMHSRKMSLLAPSFRTLATSPTAEHSNGSNGDSTEHSSPPINSSRFDDSDIDRSMSALSMNSSEDDHGRRSYASTLMTTSPIDPTEPALAITSVSDSPIAPLVLSSHHASTGPRSHPTATEGSVYEAGRVLDGPIERDDRSQRFLRYQQGRMQEFRAQHGGESDGYRDVSFRCQLPLTICHDILGYVMEAKELAILDVDMQKKAFAWGQKKETLRMEYEWRMKDTSSQVLMLLAGAQVVEY